MPFITDAEAVRRGHEWFQKHESHVRNVVMCRSRAAQTVAPSGSDRGKPELWKDIHWLWFYWLTGRDLD